MKHRGAQAQADLTVIRREPDWSGPERPLTLWSARSPSRLATLYIESSDSFVASAAVSIATGWSEPVPGRELRPRQRRVFPKKEARHSYVSRLYSIASFSTSLGTQRALLPHEQRS